MQATGVDQPDALPMLPTAILAHVLQFGLQQQRLSVCALASKHFAAAATFATVNLKIEELPPSKRPSLEAWIKQHAKQIISIKLRPVGARSSITQLRLPLADLVQLQRLDFEHQMSRLTRAYDQRAVAAVLATVGHKYHPALDLAWQVQTALHIAKGQGKPLQELPVLPKVQSLRLAYCDISSVRPLLQLSRLTNLTSLTLCCIKVCSKAHNAGAQPAGAHAQQAAQHGAAQGAQQQQGAEPMQQQEDCLTKALCTLLPQLTCLKNIDLFLELPGSGISRVIQQFISLPLLCSVGVSLHEVAAHTDDLLVGLPGNLTRLHVSDCRPRRKQLDWDEQEQEWHEQLTATFPQQHQQLRQLSDLQEFVLYGAAFDSKLLQKMTRLQHLTLEQCTLLACGPLHRNAAAAETSAAAAATALLSAIGGMTQLTCLDLRRHDYDSIPFGLDAAPSAAFEALTASTKLRELVLITKDELPLPPGAVQHKFPKGRVLPYLTTLYLDGSSTDGEVLCNREGTAGFMEPRGLNWVFEACPALQELHLTNAFATGHSFVPLLQLPTRVTNLSVGGIACGDDAARVISRLTHLQRLGWRCSPDLTDAGLERLTALHRLELLHMYSVAGLSPAVLDNPSAFEEGRCGMLSLPPYDQRDVQGMPPVWQQLQERLDLSPKLALQRLQVLKKENKDMQQRHSQSQVQLRRQVAQLQQQVAGLQQQLQHAQQQQQL